MTTEAQIAANTATNATKLGFYAKQAVLLTAEDQQAFEALTVAFRFEVHPAGPVERALCTQIVLAAWNIERANRLEAALAVDGIDPLLSEANEKTLNRIANCRMRAERTFHKCLKEMRAYQAAHPLDEPVLRNEPKPEVKNEAKSIQPTISEHKFSRVPYVRPTPKVGRNELCACKSGRKYKNCCLRNEPNPAMPVMIAVAA